MNKIFGSFPIDSFTNPLDWLFQILIFGALGIMIAGIIVTIVRRYLRNRKEQA